MYRIAQAAALTAVALTITGCSVIGSPEPSFAPERTPTVTMPGVTIAPDTTFRLLTAEQVSALTAGSVSAAVHTLTVHGYGVSVLGFDNTALEQRDWDYLSVIDITVDGSAARVTAG